MTLTPFPPDSLDELALRLLDIAAHLRQMSHTAREYEIRDFHLNSRKAEEWLANLESWANDASGRLHTEVQRAKGMRRAAGGLASATAGGGRRRAARKKSG